MLSAGFPPHSASLARTSKGEPHSSYDSTRRTDADEIAVERDRAEEVVDFLVEVFRASDPGTARGDSVTGSGPARPDRRPD